MGRGVEQLGDAVAAVAQAEARAQSHQAVEAGVEGRQGQGGEPLDRQLQRGFGRVSGDGHAQRSQQGKRTFSAVEVMPPEDQRRHPLARQQQGDQGHQIGLLAGTIEGGQQDTAWAVGNEDTGCPRLHRRHKALQFGRALAFDAQTQQDRAEFQIGHLPVEDGAEQRFGLRTVHVASAFAASAYFLDEGGELHGASVGGCQNAPS